MPSEATNQATRNEWRELGFFYAVDNCAKEWRIVGSREGLKIFAWLLRRYATDPAHTSRSEHAHFGPYMHLEIGTWDEPQITDHWVAGPLEGLLELSSLVETKTDKANVGAVISLRSDFAPTSPYDLVLELREDTFDVARADINCW